MYVHVVTYITYIHTCRVCDDVGDDGGAIEGGDDGRKPRAGTELEDRAAAADGWVTVEERGEAARSVPQEVAPQRVPADGMRYANEAWKGCLKAHLGAKVSSIWCGAKGRSYVILLVVGSAWKNSGGSENS